MEEVAPKADKNRVAEEEPKNDEPNGDAAEDTPTLAVPDAPKDPNPQVLPAAAELARKEAKGEAELIVAAVEVAKPPNNEEANGDAAKGTCVAQVAANKPKLPVRRNIVGLLRNEKGETAVTVVASTRATDPPNDKTPAFDEFLPLNESENADVPRALELPKYGNGAGDIHGTGLGNKLLAENIPNTLPPADLAPEGDADVFTASALGSGALDDASNQLNAFAGLEMAPDEDIAGIEAAEGTTKKVADEARPWNEGEKVVDGFTAGVEVEAAENAGLAKLVPKKPPPADRVMLGTVHELKTDMVGKRAGDENAAAPLTKLETQADVDDPRKLKPKLDGKKELDGKKTEALVGAGLDE